MISEEREEFRRRSRGTRTMASKHKVNIKKNNGRFHKGGRGTGSLWCECGVGGGGFFSAVSGINGSAGTCHSEGQRGTISDDDGGTDLCQHAEPSCQSKHSALWDDKDGPQSF